MSLKHKDLCIFAPLTWLEAGMTPKMPNKVSGATSRPAFAVRGWRTSATRFACRESRPSSWRGGCRSVWSLGQIVSMKIHKIWPHLSVALAVVAALLVSGCDTTMVSYSPNEKMISVRTHHSRLPLSPCLHSYDTGYRILLQEGLDRCDASQLDMYQYGRLTITSGYVSLDRSKSRVTINLTLLGFDPRDYSVGPLPFIHNGTHPYMEMDPAPGGVTRAFLQDYYRDKKPTYYYPQR